MFRLIFLSHHQGVCCMVQYKRTMCVFSRYGYLHKCSLVLILSRAKITNKTLKIQYVVLFSIALCGGVCIA